MLTLTVETKGRKPRRLLAVGLIGLGLLLFAAGGGYLLYSWIAESNLESLVYQPSEGTLNGSTPAPDDPSFLQQPQRTVPETPSSTVSTGYPDPAQQRLFPGEYIPLQYWAEPWAAEAVTPIVDLLTEGFLPVDPRAIGAMGTLPPATRVSIQAIDLDADIKELAILDLGDARAYETPKHVVGHIPESANPGEVGNIWLFGHLESLIRGEGSIFRDLPKIPGLLRNGEQVYISLQTPSGDYLYEAVGTDVLHESALTLYPAEQPTLTLVTCVPRLVYDHRLLVTARFVGFRTAGS